MVWRECGVPLEFLILSFFIFYLSSFNRIHWRFWRYSAHCTLTSICMRWYSVKVYWMTPLPLWWAVRFKNTINNFRVPAALRRWHSFGPLPISVVYSHCHWSSERQWDALQRWWPNLRESEISHYWNRLYSSSCRTAHSWLPKQRNWPVRQPWPSEVYLSTAITFLRLNSIRRHCCGVVLWYLSGTLHVQ